MRFLKSKQYSRQRNVVKPNREHPKFYTTDGLSDPSLVGLAFSNVSVFLLALLPQGFLILFFPLNLGV